MVPRSRRVTLLQQDRSPRSETTDSSVPGLVPGFHGREQASAGSDVVQEQIRELVSSPMARTVPTFYLCNR